MFTTLLSSLVIFAVVAVYLLPVIVAGIRSAPDLGAIAVVDVLLGWTVVGWIVALALAFRTAQPAPQVVQVVQNTPPFPPPPGQITGGTPEWPPRQPPANAWPQGPIGLVRGGLADESTHEPWPSADRPAGWAGHLGPPPGRNDPPPPLELHDPADPDPAEGR